MHTALAGYKSLISQVGKHLKGNGWSKKSDTFYFQSDGNWGLINFQTSRKSSKEKIDFTINLGISSTTIRLFGGDDIKEKPYLDDCHWRIRIGFLLDGHRDIWWEIGQDTNLVSLGDEISSSLDKFGTTEILSTISDNDLMELWISGLAPGITEFQRFMYLTILLKKVKSPLLNQYMDDFVSYSRNKPFETTAKVHINSLNNYE